MESNEEKLEKQAEVIEKELLIAEDLEEIKEEEVKVEGKLFYYVKTILSGVVDQMLAIGITLVLFWAFEMLLKVTGYQIIGREEIFLIIYIISNVLYYPLAQEIFHGKTLGKKIMTR